MEDFDPLTGGNDYGSGESTARCAVCGSRFDDDHELLVHATEEHGIEEYLDAEE